MNRSLKLLAAVSLSTLVFAAAPTFAEEGAKKEGARKESAEGGRKKEGGQRAGGPAERLQMLADRLNLTADQKAQAQPIIQETREAVQKIMAEPGEQKDKRAKTQQAVKEGETKLLSILTDEQKAALEKAKSERRGAKEGDGARKRDGEGAKKKGDAN